MALLQAVSNVISTVASNAPSMGHDLAGSSMAFLPNSTTTNAMSRFLVSLPGFSNGTLPARLATTTNPKADELQALFDGIFTPCWQFINNLTVFMPIPDADNVIPFGGLQEFNYWLQYELRVGLGVGIDHLDDSDADDILTGIPRLFNDLRTNLTETYLVLDDAFETPESLARQLSILSFEQFVFFIYGAAIPAYGYTMDFLANWNEANPDSIALAISLADLADDTYKAVDRISKGDIQDSSDTLMVPAANTLKALLLGFKALVGQY